MKTELHPANQRGHANHGWLDTYHNFSFATYFNPARDQFGCLRVLNDDTVAPGQGFDTHPHNNMEIITIPTEGALEHRDSMGNIQVLQPGEVQVMSAGTGLFHAEYNHSQNEPVRFFQLWIFPRAKGLVPRYDQKRIEKYNSENELITLVTPETYQKEDTLWIHQDAFISKLNLKKGAQFVYNTNIQGNGVFAFLIEGELKIENSVLKRRDAIAITETDHFQFKSTKDSNILFIEVPMK